MLAVTKSWNARLIASAAVVALGGVMIAWFLARSVEYSPAPDTRMRMHLTESAAAAYRGDHGGCPDKIDGLLAGAYLLKVPSDIQKRPFVYRCPGVHNQDGVDLESAGRDGVFGTSDDIRNWN